MKGNIVFKDVPTWHTKRIAHQYTSPISPQNITQMIYRKCTIWIFGSVGEEIILQWQITEFLYMRNMLLEKKNNLLFCLQLSVLKTRFSPWNKYKIWQYVPISMDRPNMIIGITSALQLKFLLRWTRWRQLILLEWDVWQTSDKTLSCEKFPYIEPDQTCLSDNHPWHSMWDFFFFLPLVEWFPLEWPWLFQHWTWILCEPRRTQLHPRC